MKLGREVWRHMTGGAVLGMAASAVVVAPASPALAAGLLVGAWAMFLAFLAMSWFLPPVAIGSHEAAQAAHHVDNHPSAADEAPDGRPGAP